MAAESINFCQAPGCIVSTVFPDCPVAGRNKIGLTQDEILSADQGAHLSPFKITLATCPFVFLLLPSIITDYLIHGIFPRQAWSFSQDVMGHVHT